jgi:hypothetical protein
MKTITKLIAIVGIFVLVISWAQWWFRYPDPSQLFLGTLAAIAIFGGAYVHERLSYLTQKQLSLEKRFDSFLYPKE